MTDSAFSPIALEGDAGDNLAFAVELGDAAALVGCQLDASDVLQQNGHAAFVLDDDVFEILEALDDSRGRAP